MEVAPGLQLAYCTNIHAASGWDRVFASLRQHAPELRRRLAPAGSLGLGLRLSASEAKELLEGDRRAELREWLDREGLHVALLNGFVHGDFHGQPVKDQAFAPDWREEDRLAYTLDLVRILATLLPVGMEGGISTVPLSYRVWPGADSYATRERAVASLILVTEAMVEVEDETGRDLHLDLEPEPGGLLETSRDLVDFFQTWLLPRGGPTLAERLGVTIGAAEEMLLHHVRACVDTCHLAVGYESPDRVWERFQESGVRVGRLQVTSALHLDLPQDEPGRSNRLAELDPFVDPVYLHQVVERGVDWVLRGRGDLADALGRGSAVPAESWRVHFHVPLFVERCGSLSTTQGDTVRYLELWKENPLTDHLEIETYTWDVLPPELKLNLVDSIAREYEWVLNELSRSLVSG